MDIATDLDESIAALRPDVVVHTSGPFQSQGYEVARKCIGAGCHYVDLADGRDFVCGISDLHELAKARGVSVISGASSVPCLTAAIVDQHKDEFQALETLDYGIATAQKTNRGLATTAAVLSYAGHPIATLSEGKPKTVYGWQSLHTRNLPEVGRRTFANCDIPDLEIFLARYPSLKTIRFYAGLEVPLIQFGLWLLTWPIRFGLIRSLRPLAPALLRISWLFDFMGSDVSAFYMDLAGETQNGDRRKITFNLVARSGDGPYIPCAPAIILAKRLARGQHESAGAFPCVGLIDLDAYLAELKELNIRWQVSKSGPD